MFCSSFRYAGKTEYASFVCCSQLLSITPRARLTVRDEAFLPVCISISLLQSRGADAAVDGDRRCHYVFDAQGGVGLVSSITVKVVEVRQRNLPLSGLLFLSPNDGSAALPWSLVPAAVDVVELPPLLGLRLIPQFSWRKARVASFLRVFVQANIIPLTRGGCPPLPPPDDAMRVRVLRVLLLLLLSLLLLFVHAGGLLCG